MKESIISLGKALVHELGLEPGCDTLARWMAHYVAEKIVAVENAEGNEKAKAEECCFEAVLKLWEHRSSLPNGRRPFENYEPIFRALKCFDPENPHPRYFSPLLIESETLSSPSEPITDNVKEWIEIAHGIDRAARILIQYSFKQAAIYAVDTKTENWLKLAISNMGSEDISLIIRLISGKNDSDDEESEKARSAQEKALKSKIEKLDDLAEICGVLRAALNDELESCSSGKA